jgi:hypothetical protein
MSTRVKNKKPEFKFKSVALREYLRASGPSLNLDPRIDLTMPIFEQAQKLAKSDRARPRKVRSSAA